MIAGNVHLMEEYSVSRTKNAHYIHLKFAKYNKSVCHTELFIMDSSGTNRKIKGQRVDRGMNQAIYASHALSS